MNEWYEATGTKRQTNGAFSVAGYRKTKLITPPRREILRPKELDPYYCKMHGDRKHWPLHGSYARVGERIMRADNCVYCGERVISLHTGYEWDDWRTVASVRPAWVIEEDPV